MARLAMLLKDPDDLIIEGDTFLRDGLAGARQKERE